MPSGKTHDKISTVTTPIVGLGAYLVTSDIKTTAILMFAYVFAAFMFNGDLDTNSRPYNRWWVFKMIWIPYQLMFHHRSIFTHGLVIGTAIRLLYLAAIPVVVLVLKQNLDTVSAMIHINIWLPVVIGLELGAAVHTVSDYI